MQKRPPKRTRLLPVEAQGVLPPEDVEINKFLAIYNKTGNALACQFASNHDPLFASNFDPSRMKELAYRRST